MVVFFFRLDLSVTFFLNLIYWSISFQDLIYWPISLQDLIKTHYISLFRSISKYHIFLSMDV